jgi:hypothetical protein
VIRVLLGVLAIRWTWGALRAPPPAGLGRVPAAIVLGMLASALAVLAAEGAAFLLRSGSPHRRGGTRA